ncbi:hypothetical protein YYG_04122 [Plasmodium vinckei petteri]|uniref:RRM domain-containing protein n=1 Tax=Plasmodium vinckei petteri TaxID=138298 RepID=W7APQ7_PLAVN|nr:hypothetical protein YYG_04122 [Plasmodium vinckei petteri]
MTSNDIINESNDNDAFSKIKENKNDETTKKVIDNNSLENESDNNCESREKRERSLSNGSYRRGKKKMCCCHEKSISKCSNKNDKSSSSSRSKNTDTLSTASTGIIEYGSSSKNINEPFKFFIGGIPQNITNKYITEYFEKYGPVQNVVIAQDHETKRNRGFAFVTMSSHINKDKILMDSHELNGKRVDVREEHNTTPSDIQRKIFVGGLSYYWTKDTLERHKQIKKKYIYIYIIENVMRLCKYFYFSAFGEIDIVQIVVDSSGRSRCFGFVVFTNESSVAKVLKHKRHKIYDKMVEVRKAEPKKPKMSMKRQNNKSHSKYSHPPPFMGPFPYNKESMTQWANFMYNACGVPFLFNQRFQNVPDFYSNYNYYPNSVENMQQPDYNN